MAGPKVTTSLRTCPEPVLDAKGKETGRVCGVRHMSTGCDTCPAHIEAAAKAFWATMPGGTMPDTTPHPAAPVLAPPKPQRKRPGKRHRAKKG